MEEQLKLFPLLTLKEMALRTIAVLLWSHPHVLGFVSNFKFLLVNKRARWKSIEDIVEDKVLKLPLPESLMKQVSHRVTPVGLEIREWKRIHENRYLNDDGEDGLPGSTKLCWTTTGRINYLETAKELFRNEFDIMQHYRIACDYCLEDYVALFWEKSPEHVKAYFSREDKIRTGLSFQWPHMLKGKYSKLDELSRRSSGLSFNRYSFENSVRACEKSAARYFLMKLTHKEREVSVRNVFHMLIRLIYSEAMHPGLDCRGVCYLLTVMTPEQQMKMLREHSSAVCLSLFLDSVWPDPFAENAALIWKHLHPSGYAFLQRKIAAKYESTDHHSPLLFEQFFACSPPEFKKCFMCPESESVTRSLLSAFFKREDSECAGTVFRNLDASDRVKLVFQIGVLQLFVTDIFRDQWRTVEACLRGAKLSEKECKRLKEELAEVIERCYPNVVRWGNLKLESFFVFFHGTGSSDEEGKKGLKRKLGNCSP